MQTHYYSVARQNCVKTSKALNKNAIMIMSTQTLNMSTVFNR